MGFREVFGRLHEDHKEYLGPQPAGGLR
jgi:hypothetical protein